MEKIKTKECSICGKQFMEYGNNARPVNDGICCDECNYTVVIPTRMGLIAQGRRNGING